MNWMVRERTVRVPSVLRMISLIIEILEKGKNIHGDMAGLGQVCRDQPTMQSESHQALLQ